jgi:hypothetical protein
MKDSSRPEMTSQFIWRPRFRLGGQLSFFSISVHSKVIQQFRFGLNFNEFGGMTIRR